jgi:glutathione peroxidase
VKKGANMQQVLYNAEFMINDQIHTLAEWQDKTILVVNSATKCGFSPQFEGLQALHEKYHQQGLLVIAFPCDQFKHQEPETDQTMASVCELNFGATFPLTHKIEVNGDNAHAIFKELKSRAPGIFGSQKIKWNFTKFLISPNGECIERFAPNTKPQSIESKIIAMIER